MNIAFSAVDANFIKAKVKEGYYSNATELVRDAVRRLREANDSHYATFMTAIAEGDADIAAGRYDEYTPELLANIEKEALAKHHKGKRS